MLTGKNIDARGQAHGPRRRLRAAAPDGKRGAHAWCLSGRPPRQLPLLQRLMNGPLNAHRRRPGARSRWPKRARPEHYPAPYAIIDMWQQLRRQCAGRAGRCSRPRSMPSSPRHDARTWCACSTCRSASRASARKRLEFAPRRVHVVGAGVMGGDIAAWCALRGLTVTLQDQDVERIAPAIARAAKLFARRLKRAKSRCSCALDRLIPDPQGRRRARRPTWSSRRSSRTSMPSSSCSRDSKRRAKPDALLATNTSSLRLEDIAHGAEQSGAPGRHPFLQPGGEDAAGGSGARRRTPTQPTRPARAAAFVRRLDKLPLPVKRRAGLPGQRRAGALPARSDALRGRRRGAEPWTRRMVAFGMPMGPMELADTVGLDVALAAGRQLAGSRGRSAAQACRPASPPAISGKKSGRGFYAYRRRQGQQAGRPARRAAGLAERLVAPLRRRARGRLVAKASSPTRTWRTPASFSAPALRHSPAAR